LAHDCLRFISIETIDVSFGLKQIDPFVQIELAGRDKQRQCFAPDLEDREWLNGIEIGWQKCR
jgi:hypothetical protein